MMAGRRGESDRNYHVGIPNIPAEAVRWYLSVFNAITVYLTVTNTLFVLTTQQIIGWQAVQYVVTGELLKAGGVALIASPVITEVSRVVIGAMWTKRKVEEAVQHNQAQWEAWLQRREEAEARGEPFTEPPPHLENRRRRWP